MVKALPRRFPGRSALRQKTDSFAAPSGNHTDHIIAIRLGKHFARLAEIVADHAAKALFLKALGLPVHVPGHLPISALTSG